MPKMDGVELLEAVKKIKPEIPIDLRSWRYGNGY
jgi:CheY-like chemotaxis protein